MQIVSFDAMLKLPKFGVIKKSGKRVGTRSKIKHRRSTLGRHQTSKAKARKFKEIGAESRSVSLSPVSFQHDIQEGILSSIQSLWVDVRTQSGLWYFMPLDLICILPWLLNQSTLPRWLIHYGIFRVGFIMVITGGLWSIFDVIPSFSALILALSVWVCLFASWIDLTEKQQSS